MKPYREITRALHLLTDLTSTRSRGWFARRKDDADLQRALRRAAPAVIEILVSASADLKHWPSSDVGKQATAVHLAQLINRG